MILEQVIKASKTTTKHLCLECDAAELELRVFKNLNYGFKMNELVMITAKSKTGKSKINEKNRFY